MKQRIIALALVLAIFAVVADSAQARCRNRSCSSHYVIQVAPPKTTNTFEFQVPYDFTANSDAITAQPSTDKFAIKLKGDSATIATFVGEKVKFTARCIVLVPAANLDALKKTANPVVYLKPINVTLESTLDDEGVAEFSKTAVYEAVKAEVARIRLWDQPSLFGLENFNIKVTGVARVGSFIFKNSNVKCLTGKVE